MPKKKPTVGTLKKKADKLWSEYVRRSNADEYGMVQCYTCPSTNERIHWKAIQNGHFVSRTHTSTRFHKKNCKPQCIACNVWRRGNPSEFARNLVKEYGPEVLDELHELRNTTVKMRVSDYEELIEELKQQLANLEE